MGARSDSLSRAVYLGRSLPRAAHSSARAALSLLRLLRPARAGAGELHPMDERAGTPLTPSYSRDPSTAAAAANPSPGGVGLASAGAPPTIGLARGLYMPPRMTSVAGGVAPAPARAAAPPQSSPMRRGQRRARHRRRKTRRWTAPAPRRRGERSLQGVGPLGGMGGMGPPPAAMGGMSFDVPPHTHSHEGAVEDLANTVGASRDAVRNKERGEESSSEEAESSSEDEDEDEEED